MKKAIRFLLILLLVLLFVSCDSNSAKVSSKLKTPSITPASYSGGEKIPGGVRYTVTNNEPDSTLYYGVLSEEEYKMADFLWTKEGKKWEFDQLINKQTSTDSVCKQDFKTKGRWYLYAVSVSKSKSSVFAVQVVEVNAVNLQSYDIHISRGVISNTGTGEYTELYASLDPNMKDEVLVYDGMLPFELMGKNVYFQTRNTNGWADSEPVMVKVEGMKIDAPYIQTNSSLRGYDVQITKPSVYIGTGGVGRGGQYAPEEDVDVYYTLDGSKPNSSTSNKYNGVFTISEEGSFTVKAIAVYKGLESEVASSRYSINLTKIANPTVKISGLDVSISSSNGSSTYIGYSQDEISTETRFFLVGEEDIGKTIYIQAVRNGYAPSDIIEIPVASLTVFQEQYSSDKSRQFGFWRVEEDINSKGKATGNYTICGRWPYGNSMYMIAVAQLNNKNQLSGLIFCSPSRNGSTSNVSVIYDRSKSIGFEVDGVSYSIPYDVYQINQSTYTATYKIVATDEAQPQLFKLLNSGKVFTTVASMQDELNGLDLLTGMGVAGQYYNPEAAYSAYLNSIELNESQFVFSTDGLADALSYYKKVTAK